MKYTRVFGVDSVGKNGYTLENSKFHSYPKHCHIFYEMLLYQPFDGNITINEKKYFCKTPTAILVTPSVFHNINVESEFVNYKKIIFSSYIIKKEILKHIGNSFYYPDVDPLFTMLIERLFTIEDNKDFIIPIIHTLLIEMIKKGKPVKLDLPDMNIKLITDTINIINNEFTNRISLETVSKRLNVSKQYLSSKFTKVVGKTFTDYLNNIRLKYAATLLTESEFSISDICYRSGFNNFSYFSRSFKKNIGMSPSEFKNSIK